MIVVALQATNTFILIGAPADAVSVIAIGAVNPIEIELLLVLQVPLMTSE
jgi:hypothetical protein